MKGNKLYLLYAKGETITGQQAACEFTARVFKRLGFNFDEVWLPALDRTSKNRNKFFCVLSYGFKILVSWTKALKFLEARNNVFVHVIGQSWIALLRDLVPMLACAAGRFRRNSVITVLHSNLFIEWPANSLKLKFFKWYLMRSHTILALGTQQKLHLIRIGVTSPKVIILPNTCEVSPIALDRLLIKHFPVDKVQCLFLSNLIDTKGYPQYVEACGLLSDTSKSFRAVLCGPYIDSSFNNRFADFSEVESFIKSAIKHVEKSKTATLEWVAGARGVHKQTLFDEAQIFVFPTCITGEAQPLVILEAMASGAAIITTRFREITDLVDGDSAILLDEITPQTVAQAMQRLIDDPQLRLRLATNALKRFEQRFSFESFTEHWKRLLENHDLA